MKSRKIAIVGTVGIPAIYGGFETLAENLAVYHNNTNQGDRLSIYCSSKAYPERNKKYLKTHLYYLPLSANGLQSIFYDFLSLTLAVLHRNDVILLLGVSGAISLPLVRLFSSATIVTNIDGIEWKRDKWKRGSKIFLRCSESIAVRFSHKLISDNGAICKYIESEYGCESTVIAYGGDHAVKVQASEKKIPHIPVVYAFKVCRIEPENNIEMVLKAFANSDMSLVVVGNWNASTFGKAIREEYSLNSSIIMLDPIYDLGVLKTLRMNATWYIHGHSAGGTNPSLVEAMHFGIPIAAFDCEYNRQTTSNNAKYFDSAETLRDIISRSDCSNLLKIGLNMKEIAQSKYTWNLIGEQYFKILTNSKSIG